MHRARYPPRKREPRMFPHFFLPRRASKIRLTETFRKNLKNIFKKEGFLKLM